MSSAVMKVFSGGESENFTAWLWLDLVVSANHSSSQLM
jgi:hypothetical protein